MIQYVSLVTYPFLLGVVMAQRTIYINISHYCKGARVAAAAAIPIPHKPLMTIQRTLTDIFARLRVGAEMTTSGFSYGLVIYESTDDGAIVGNDKVIYNNASARLRDFIIRATKWWHNEGDTIDPGTPSHDQFVRRTLLGCTRHQLSDKEMAYALSMSEDDFLAAMALSLESDVLVTELFQD